MSNLDRASKSLSPGSSEQSLISEHRTPDRWWHWGSESPKHADHFQSFVLTQKRNRKKSRRFPEPELYSGEADADARKRMRPLESHYDHQSSQGQILSDSGSEARVNFSTMNENSRTRNEIGRGVGTFEDKVASPKAQVIIKNGATSNSQTSSAKEIQLLKLELELVRTHYNKKISTSERNIQYLQEENFALCERVHWYKTQYEARKGGSTTSDEVRELRAELERKNIEIEEKIRQNSSLEEQINTAEGLSGILKDSQAGNNVSVRISEDLSELETAVNQAALLLLQCLSDKKFSQLRKKPCRKPELYALINSSLGKMSIISFDPKVAFSALLFGFIRERICYSTCWTSLQREGYMLKGYQSAIERITPQGTLEEFHRAAVELMLEENHPFRDCWVQLQARESQSELLQLLSPLLEIPKFEGFEKDIQNTLKRVFIKAFQFRARCVPPRGTRYELIQIKAGDIFDPRYMEAQRPDGSFVSVPSGETRRVKVCVHGCLVSHAFEEEPLKGEPPDTIAQPFVLAEAEQSDIVTTSNNGGRGVLKSGKAIVILED